MTTSDTFDALVGVKEAAQALGMGQGSLYRLARAGAVPSYKAGVKLSGVRFSIKELRQALRRNAKPAATTEA